MLKFLWQVILESFKMKPLQIPTRVLTVSESNSAVAEPTIAIPIPAPSVPTMPKFAWDTREHIRHSIRVICDEEGLDVEQKNTMCATIYGESEFNLHAVNKNYAFKEDGTKYIASIDWGLCQWNDYWHEKEITIKDAINDPEKAVRLMCKYWKQNQRHQWIAYKNGRYKKFLVLTSQPM